MRIWKCFFDGTRTMASSLGKARAPLPPTRPKSSIVRQTKPQIREVRSTASTPTNKRNTRHSKSDSNIAAAFQKLKLQENNHHGKTSISQSRRGSTYSTRSSECNSIEDIARVILNKKAKNIVVMAGAGISTPSGIPDFRTPGTGLYDNLQKYKIPYPEAIFDIDYLHRDPRPFFTLAKELFPGNYRPNYVHYFVRMLYEKGLLLRMYTQNIDGLERLAGIPASKLVEAHGTFATSSCIRCDLKHSVDDVKDKIMIGKIPRCKAPYCTGTVKPDIVFFGEDLPRRFYYYLKDFPQCDLLIVMGTSLEVYPFAGIVDSTRSYIPRLLINRQSVGPFASRTRFNDATEIGDIVEGVKKLARVLGWKKGMEDLIQECESKYEESQGRSSADSSNGKQDTGENKDGENGIKNGVKSTENGLADNQDNEATKQSDNGTAKDSEKTCNNDNPTTSGQQSQQTATPSTAAAAASNSTATQSKPNLKRDKNIAPKSAPSLTPNRNLSTSAKSRNESISELKVGKYVYTPRQSVKPNVNKTDFRLPQISNHQSKKTINYVRSSRGTRFAATQSSSSEESTDDSSQSSDDS
ncbi:uncharacterized protein LOC144448127 [Glandiceps talaboti]